MNRLRQLGMAVVMVVFLAGCEPNKPIAAAPTQEPDYPTAAQPKLATITLWVGGKQMVAEVAKAAREMQTGMMFRTSMGADDGMIFVFPQPHQASFWMKNTVLPLSAAYLDPAGTILEIHDLKPQDTNSVTAASVNVQYVLETNRGWFEKNKIKVGTVIRTELGSLRQSFFR